MFPIDVTDVVCKWKNWSSYKQLSNTALVLFKLIEMDSHNSSSAELTDDV